MARGVNTDKLVSYAQSLPPLTIKPDSFYFLRHGQTPGNALKIFQTYAEPLSEVGIQQAAQAAAVLSASPPEPVRTICVSDATRTLQTAAPIADALGLTALPTVALRERHFGDLWGTSSACIDWDCAPENGETLTEFVDRTRAALGRALNYGHDDPVLIVAHGGNLFVLASMLRIPLDERLFGNALPIYFKREGGGWTASPLVAPSDEPAGLA